MEVILYSTGCPKCNVLKKKMQAKGVQYSEVNEIKEMRRLGILSVPVLSVNGELLDFSKANNWINMFDNSDNQATDGQVSYVCSTCNI